MKVTHHARKRLKERCGVDEKSSKKWAKKVFDEGITYEQTGGKLKEWLRKCYSSNEKESKVIRVYDDTAYIYDCGKNPVLVTAISVPDKFKEK